MDRREALNKIVGMTGGALAAGITGAYAAPSASSDSPKKPGRVILPPDPNTKTPAYKVPPGACDAHCHIFGPASRYPYSPKRSYTPPDAGLDAFRLMHRKIGVDRAVIVNASLYGADNRVIVDAIAASEGRYRGIANIDDSISDAQLIALDKGGVRGCRFSFVKHLGGFPDMAVFHRTVKRIARLGWHVDLYFDAADIPQFQAMLQSLPLPYSIDHMGRVHAKEGLEQEPFKILLALLERDKKCHVKISGPDRISSAGAPFHDAVPYAGRLIETAPDRVLWGTDWPHPNVKTMPNDGDLVDLIPHYTSDPALQKKLLVDNPARLYQFED